MFHHLLLILVSFLSKCPVFITVIPNICTDVKSITLAKVQNQAQPASNSSDLRVVECTETVVCWAITFKWRWVTEQIPSNRTLKSVITAMIVLVTSNHWMSWSRYGSVLSLWCQWRWTMTADSYFVNLSRTPPSFLNERPKRWRVPHRACGKRRGDGEGEEEAESALKVTELSMPHITHIPCLLPFQLSNFINSPR